MKVVFCAHDRPGNYSGGPNAWLLRLLPDLKQRKFSVVTLITGPGLPELCPLVNSLQGFGIPVRFLDTSDGIGFVEPCLRWLVKQLNELRPDVFVPNLMIPAYFAARFARRGGIPCIGVIHSNDAFHHHLLETFVYGAPENRIDAVVAVSRHLETMISRQMDHKIMLRRIPYGVPVPDGDRVRVDRPLRICYVGRFRQEQKRILEVTLSFCAASKVFCGATFTMVGNGPEKDDMIAIIAQQNAQLSVTVSVPLPSTQIQRFLESQDVFVLLSDYEGLPIALQEAMSVGVVPVCLREESGIAELIQHRENGLILADRDHGTFIEALRLLDQDRALLRRLSTAARSTIKEGYAAPAQHDKWAALLGEMALQGDKRRIRLPIALHLPAPHADFRGEDMHAPPVSERIGRTLRQYMQAVKLAIRPRSRLREIRRKVLPSR